MQASLWSRYHGLKECVTLLPSCGYRQEAAEKLATEEGIRAERPSHKPGSIGYIWRMAISGWAHTHIGTYIYIYTHTHIYIEKRNSCNIGNASQSRF